MDIRRDEGRALGSDVIQLGHHPGVLNVIAGRGFTEKEEDPEGIEEDIKIGIRIAEAEMDHDIRKAFNALKNKTKKKKAKQLLQEITAISLSGDEDDKNIMTFAKVLQLEKVLGIS